LEGDPCPFRQHTQGLWKIDSFDPLNEIENIAAGAAGPTFKRLAFGIELERRAMVVVKGAKNFVL
jgi:hypothetical protein